MRDSESESKNSLLRTIGKFIRIAAIIIFLLIILAVVLIVIPVERDMKIRKEISSQVQAGRAISHALIRFRIENGTWPEDSAEFSRDNFEILSDGLVRVHLTALEYIEGKWADLEISIENGNYFLSCRVPGVKSGRLPAWCREGRSAIEVRLE